MASARLAISVVLAIIALGCYCSCPMALASSDRASLVAKVDPARPRISFLSWDTEGGKRSERNLLRPNAAVHLRARVAGQWRELDDRLAEQVHGRIAQQGDGLAISVGVTGAPIEALELVFPFDPRITATTVLAASWDKDAKLHLPAIINAPDFGQMLVECPSHAEVKGRLEGHYAQRTADLILEVPTVAASKPCVLRLRPLILPVPATLEDKALWPLVRRGWFGAFEPLAGPAPGDDRAADPNMVPAGMLGNELISGTGTMSVWFYADQAFFIPRLTDRISVMDHVRRTVDWILDHRWREKTGLTGYWMGKDYTDFLDSNPSILIAAWDYVDATDDRAWLKGRIGRLEQVADYLARRDIDGDGLVEAVQSGNAGTLVQPGRGCSWWDALNSGHKDGYCNALIYRAWRCLADLEAKLGRDTAQARYSALADRLKAAYAPTLMNPRTGWLAWWKSRDGQLHDYASPTLNGLAIEYGLVEGVQGRAILKRLAEEMKRVGFQRFDLGVPPMLHPVRREDYLIGLAPGECGSPAKEDGSDTFQHYMNGGITAGQSLHFLAAHYVVDQPEPADAILRQMLQRQARGEFQNGVHGVYPEGMDCTTWDGQPAGADGYLADSFRFLQAIFLREPAMRERFYRPLRTPGAVRD